MLHFGEILGEKIMITRIASGIQKTLRPRLVNAESKRIFSFASKSKILSKNGDINSNGLVLTHLTDFAPSNGVIESAKDAIGWYRNSVHFATNHGVVSHSQGNWISKKYSIIMPYQNVVKTKGNKIVGGVPADLYSEGSIKIPKGSVIVRYNEKIPKGKFKITDSSKIDEFKRLKGIKIIETSEKDMQLATDKVIEKLGYEVKSSNHPFVFGKTYNKDGFSMLDKFNKFLKQHKMKPMIHSYTPNARTERLLENLGFRSKYLNNWIVKDKDGTILINYKDKYLDILKNIAKDSQKNNYKSEYDIEKIATIIQKSKTPKEAEKLLLEKLNLKTLLVAEGNINELSLYQHLGFASEFNDDILSIAKEYLKHPSRELLNQFELAGRKHNLKYVSSKQLFDAGAFEEAFRFKDNEIANKLEKLG